MTPHWLSRCLVKERQKKEKSRHQGWLLLLIIWKAIQSQAHACKNVLEHSDHLKRQNVLTIIVSNFEDGLLPHIILCMRLNPH